MPREKLLIKFNDEVRTVPGPLTRDMGYQNDLQGATYPEVFGFRADDSRDSEHFAIIDRVIDYFHRLNDSHDLENDLNEDLWGSIMRVHYRSHYVDFGHALVQRDREAVSETLRNICKTKLVFGFYSSDISESVGDGENSLPTFAWHIFDTLVSIATAFGYPLVNPEQGHRNWADIDFEHLFEFVLYHVPALRYPPSAGGGIFGLNTLNGVIAWRDLSAAFNATRVVENLGDLPPKVAEIGGGMGGLAYFLSLAGISTSVFDLPLVSLLQSYFLMTSLGGDQVWIHGEVPNPSARVHILPWWEFSNADDGEFPLVVNVDSLPEIESRVALNYIDAIHSKGQRYFLSINQESAAINFGASAQNIVGDLIAIRGGFKRSYRFPYWLRAGYAEELYQIL